MNSKLIFIFFLIMARLGGMVSTAPVFSRREVFPIARLLIVFWTASVLIYVVPLPRVMPVGAVGFIMAFICEAFLGFIIGFTMDIFVTGIELAGNLMDSQAGLSVASMLDPSSGRQITLLSLLLKWVALILFLLVDGHHLVLSALVHSFQILPVGGHFNLAAGSYEVIKIASYIFFLGVQLSAPVLLIIFLVDFGFGILNKVAEQVNVFQLGFQIKPSVSLFIFWLTAPGIVSSVNLILEHISDHLLHIFHALLLPTT